MITFPFSIFQTILVALGLLVLYKFVYVPYMKLRFYKKQGLHVEFFPLIGSFILNLPTSLKKHNDALYNYKELAAKKPELKALAMNFGSTPVVIFLDPALKKDFAFHHDCYELGNFFGDYAKVFSVGLTGVTGNEWKKQRKIIAQSFHFEFLKDNVPMIFTTTKNLLNELSNKKLDNITILPEMEKIAGENIARTFFSENLDHYTIKGKTVTVHLMDTLTKLGQVLMSPAYLAFGSKFIGKGLFKSHRELIEDVKLIETTCQKIINDRRNSAKTTRDLAWYLLESQKNPSEEDRLSDEIIIGNYVVFITAGTGTTSHLVSMTLYLLTQHPEVFAKLKEEIKEVYEKEFPPSLDTLNKMNWLSAILKETLRLYNPSGIGAGFKTASKDHKVGDIEIKKGSMVGASFLHNGFDPNYFENPTAFVPQRWIDRPNLPDAFAFTPFWAGPRNCIGQHLAQIEAKIIVCEFIKKFEFDMVNGFKLKMGVKRGYGPMDDLPMKLSVRSDKL